MLLSVLSLTGITACHHGTDETIAPVEKPITFETPAHFPPPLYRFTDNPVTPAGFNLGKTLFYDARLSRNNTISCGSCHIQENAFTHHGHDVSHGIEDRLGIRNTPAIQNMAWAPAFFWDGGVHDLDLQPIAPIENPVEMDEKLENVLRKLRSDNNYPLLFQQAFGTRDITTARMLKALSQFMVMLVSAGAKYDHYLQGKETFTEEEKHGLQLFQEKCATCHAGPLFTDNSYRNNGVAPRPVGADSGRYNITLNMSDLFKFRVPGLRNVAITAPYMHDGRFGSLKSVLNHYSDGIEPSVTLDPLLKQGIPLSETEKTKLIAFLKTLTDKEFIRDKRFAPPEGFDPGG